MQILTFVIKNITILPIKNLYSDEELTMMLYKNEQENIGYFNNKFINNELYECLKDLHIKYGYIYVSKDIEQQKEQIEIHSKYKHAYS